MTHIVHRKLSTDQIYIFPKVKDFVHPQLLHLIDDYVAASVDFGVPRISDKAVRMALYPKEQTAVKEALAVLRMLPITHS